MQEDNIQVRIRCTQRGEDGDVIVSSKRTETVSELKHSLLRAWPLKWPRARTATDMRMIFLGKELQEQEKIAELAERNKADVLTLHLIVRERNPGSPSTPLTPTVHYQGSPVRVRQGPLFSEPESPSSSSSSPQKASEDQEAPPHFHAVTVSERELSEFRMIFDRKKGADGLISMTSVRSVLQSYWRFIHREGFQEGHTPFPMERLEGLRRKVEPTGNATGLTLDQFLTVFYLFDNVASEEPCMHGERERVRMACAQLHGVMQPQAEFYHDKFEHLFSMVCSDENGAKLTCKEMELLYYMYSAFVLEKIREEELVAKVQAIVRMRIQSSKYTKMVGAARTLQNAWRMRMFAADRNNHAKIAQFLKSLMTSDKVGASPRNL